MSRAIIKHLGRPMLAATAYYSGYCRLVAKNRGLADNHILSYHGINNTPNNPYAIQIDDFTQHMEFLRDQCAVISMDQLAACLRSGQVLPPNAIAVTIDDGYADAYTWAFPALRRLGIPATIFLPTAFIGNATAAAAVRMSQTEFLTWDQVREMRRQGIYFGSHTVDHVSLTRVTPEEAYDQLVRSKDKLEVELDEPVSGFAYPYGTVRDVSAQVEHLVTAAGYSWAVTGISGRNNERSRPVALRRIKIERGDSLSLVAWATQGALDPWVAVDRLGKFVRV